MHIAIGTCTAVKCSDHLAIYINCIYNINIIRDPTSFQKFCQCVSVPFQKFNSCVFYIGT